MFIQSFEVGNLRQLNHMTKVRLIQLVDCSGAPWDFRAAGDPRTYADLITPDGLKFVDRYADGPPASTASSRTTPIWGWRPSADG